VVRFVEDQQRTGAQLAEVVAKVGGVRLVDQQALGDEEPAVRGPGVGAVAAFASDARDVVAVEDHGGQAETAVEFVAPLQQHRRRADDDEVVDAAAQQQLARDEAGFDRLAEAHVVGDEQVDARELERLAQRFELVRLDLDAGPERRLEQGRVGGGDAVPPHRVQERSEQARFVEALLAEVAPPLLALDLGVEFLLPEDRELVALGVVVEAGEADQGAVVVGAAAGDVLDEPPAHAHLDDLAGDRRGGELGHGSCTGSRRNAPRDSSPR
jgi:hypothetical protein